MPEQPNWQAVSGKLLFESLPEPALLVGVDGAVIAGNQQACELFGFNSPFPVLPVDQLLTQPERKRLQVMSWLRKWADTPSAPELDYVYLSIMTQSGVQKHLSTRVSRLQLPSDAKGELVAYLVTMHDIGPWESRLRREQKAYKTAAHVLAQCADSVLIVNEAQQITYANRSADELFGHGPKGLVGKPLAQLLPERFRESHPQWMANFAKEPLVSRFMDQRAPVLALTRRGTEVAVEASITRIRLAGELLFSVHMRKVVDTCPP